MSLIACVSECVYQQDGCCNLERAATCGIPSAQNQCIHYVPKRGGFTEKNTGSVSISLSHRR